MPVCHAFHSASFNAAVGTRLFLQTPSLCPCRALLSQSQWPAEGHGTSWCSSIGYPEMSWSDLTFRDIPTFGDNPIWCRYYCGVTCHHENCNCGIFSYFCTGTISNVNNVTEQLHRAPTPLIFSIPCKKRRWIRRSTSRSLASHPGGWFHLGCRWSYMRCSIPYYYGTLWCTMVHHGTLWSTILISWHNLLYILTNQVTRSILLMQDRSVDLRTRLLWQ